MPGNLAEKCKFAGDASKGYAWISGTRRSVLPSWRKSAARTRSRNSSYAATCGAGATDTARNVRGLPGTPDVVLRKYGVAIFVHTRYLRVDGHIPHSNSTFWRKKIERNKARDERNKEELRKMGWRVMTIWECQLKPAVRGQTLLEMEYWINHAYLERLKPKPAKAYGEMENSPSVAAEGSVEYGESKPFDIVE